MKKIILGLAGLGLMLSPALAQPANNNPHPSCNMCEGVYVPPRKSRPIWKAVKEHKIDQQVRDIDIGKAHIALGVEHRGKLDKPGAAGGGRA